MVDLLNCNNINLKQGSKGGQVSLLQTHLKSLGYYTTSGGYYLKIDGDFATYTTQAVKSFQRAMGLVVDGIVGPITCKKVNEKIQSKNSTPTQTSGGSTSTTTTKATTSTNTKVVDPYKPDLTKNIMEQEDCNISFDGIRFIATSVTLTNNFRSGNWKTIELMNGRNYIYKGRPLPYEYTVETILHKDEFRQLENEIDKICSRICEVWSNQFRNGKYIVSVSMSNEKLTHKKLTFKLVEAWT